MYIINIRQKNLLESLYFNLYILKYKNLDNIDKKQIDNNIKFLFEELDTEKTSYKIQNIVMSLVEDKKNNNKYFINLLNENNIIIQ